MVKVVQRGRFSVYVYAESGQPHHLPHCHVYWSDGESVVDLARLSVLKGDSLPAPARAAPSTPRRGQTRLDAAESGDMTATTIPRRWQTREYGRIVAARYQDGHLLVTFADGSEASVAVDRFDNPYLLAQAPDWTQPKAGVHEVIVPSAAGELGIPWDSIRALTDAEFAAHWAAMAAEVARGAGRRVRELREERGLSPAELADRAGVPVEVVAGLEAGQESIDLSLLDRVLAAMGCHTGDLSDDPERDGA